MIISNISSTHANNKSDIIQLVLNVKFEAGACARCGLDITHCFVDAMVRL
jgi:hypothetical protein